MKIEASDREIREIFSLGHFIVPRFQRPYSWTEDEVNSFWDDVTGEQSPKKDPVSTDYFIGSMVVYQVKKPFFGIVDGQQRLTTITLILAAIRNAFLRLKQENLAQGVQNYIEKPNMDNVKEYILKSETSFPYLQSHIQSYNGLKVNCEPSSEEQSLKIAFNLIIAKFDGLLPTVPEAQTELFDESATIAIEMLKVIRDKVLGLKLVLIQLDDEDDAYLIFETLNARGRDLTTSDLVKNYLLKRIKEKNADLDAAKVVWNRMLKRFDSVGFKDGMEAFLYHYWLSAYGYLTDKELFTGIKKQVDTPDKAVDFLHRMQENVEYYISTVRPEDTVWKTEESAVCQSLQALSTFGVKQQSSMVLSLFRAYRTKKISLRELRQILEKIEHFHYIFNAVTSQRSSGVIATNYSKFAVALTNASTQSQKQLVLDDLIEVLGTKVPSFSEFKASFDDRFYTSKYTMNKVVIRYTLRKIMGQSTHGLAIDHEAMTIEHLLPESQERAGTISTEVIGSIGNLILLDSKTNSEMLGNSSFNEKKRILTGANYPFDDLLLSHDHWSEPQIRERTGWIIQTAYDIAVKGWASKS